MSRKHILCIIVLALIMSLLLCFNLSAQDETALKIEKMPDPVVTYVDCVNNYLNADFSEVPSNFMDGCNDQHKPVVIKWSFNGDDVETYRVVYSTDPTYENAAYFYVDSDKNQCELINLLKGTEYYVKVYAHTIEEVYEDEITFTTTDKGARFLYVGDPFWNWRDVGGYTTLDGFEVKQNLMLRGSAFEPVTYTEGWEFLNNEVGIKLEIDMRNSTENNNKTSSKLANASYIDIPLSPYMKCFDADQADYYRDVFKLFADKNNYPIYFHCAGGADRTGTVALILESLLNYDYESIIRDYEFTSFSVIGDRDRKNVIPIMDKLLEYGNSYQQGAENYLLSIGVTMEEIHNIRAIMFGMNPDVYPFVDVSHSSYYYPAVAWAYEKSITKGCGHNMFMPNENATRAQVITYLWKVAGSPEAGIEKSKFTDVNANAYYYKALLWAEENEITSGTSGNTFSPDAICSRCEVIMMLWKSKNMPYEPFANNPFSDVDQSAWYYDAVIWAGFNNITKGSGNGLFSPKSLCQRSQILTFVYNSIE